MHTWGKERQTRENKHENVHDEKISQYEQRGKYPGPQRVGVNKVFGKPCMIRYLGLYFKKLQNSFSSPNTSSPGLAVKYIAMMPTFNCNNWYLPTVSLCVSFNLGFIF